MSKISDAFLPAYENSGSIPYGPPETVKKITAASWNTRKRRRLDEGLAIKK